MSKSLELLGQTSGEFGDPWIVLWSSKKGRRKLVAFLNGGGQRIRSESGNFTNGCSKGGRLTVWDGLFKKSGVEYIDQFWVWRVGVLRRMVCGRGDFFGKHGINEPGL